MYGAKLHPISHPMHPLSDYHFCGTVYAWSFLRCVNITQRGVEVDCRDDI